MELPEAELIAEIDAFCAARGMSPHTLGKLALNDTGMMTGLRDGREMRRATRQKVRDFMAGYQAQAAE